MRSMMLAALVTLAGCGQSMTTEDAGPVDAWATPPDAADLCTTTCAAVQLCCDVGGSGRCIDPQYDPANCGGCGIACPSGQCLSGLCAAP